MLILPPFRRCRDVITSRLKPFSFALNLPRLCYSILPFPNFLTLSSPNFLFTASRQLRGVIQARDLGGSQSLVLRSSDYNPVILQAMDSMPARPIPTLSLETLEISEMDTKTHQVENVDTPATVLARITCLEGYRRLQRRKRRTGLLAALIVVQHLHVS